MKKTADETLGDLRPIGLYPDFTTSSTKPLIEQLKEAKDSQQLSRYRELFEDFSAQGTIPHERSILSPAAYLTDLVRLVLAKERPALETDDADKRLAPAQRLVKRRPDLLEIPLDKAHTNDEKPYLTFVNAILRRKLMDMFQRHEITDKELANGDYTPFAADTTILKLRAALDIAGVEARDLFHHLRYPGDYPTMAQLGFNAKSWNAVNDRGQHYEMLNRNSLRALAKPFLPVPESGGQNRLKDFLPRLGIDAEILAAITHERAGISVISRYISEAIRQAAKDERKSKVGSRAYVFVEDENGLVLAHYASHNDANTPPPEGPTKVVMKEGGYLNPDHTTDYAAALAELARLGRITRAIGWGAAKFLHFADMMSGSENAFSWLGYDVPKIMVFFSAIEKRFDLDFGDLETLFSFDGWTDRAGLNGAPSLLDRRFPWPFHAGKYNNFSVANVPNWLTGAAGLSRRDVQLIFAQKLMRDAKDEGRPSDLADIQNDEIRASGRILSLPCQYAILATMLDREVEEIIALQDMLDIGFETWKDVRAIIDGFDAVKASGLSFADIRSILQVSTTATCTYGLLQQASTAVRDQLGLGDDDLTDPEELPEGALDWDNEWAVIQALSRLHDLPTLLVEELVRRSMDDDAKHAMISKLITNGWAGYGEDELALTSPETIAFSNLQAAFLFVSKLKLSVDDLGGCNAEALYGIKPSELNDWRNFGDFLRFSRAKNIERDTGINIAALQSQFETDLYAPMRSMERDAVRAFEGGYLEKLAKLTGMTTEDIDPLWQNRENPIPLLSEGEDQSLLDKISALRAQAKAQTKLGLDRQHYEAITKLFDRSLELGVDMDGDRSVDTDENWKKCEAITESVLGGVQSRVEGSTWEQSQIKIEAASLEHIRDALARAIIWHWNFDFIPDAERYPTDVNRFEDLSDIFLVDIQMGGTALISQIKLALNTVQHYLHRVTTNQEIPRPFTLDYSEWTWRAHYRLWEANRKVFLFPENYLDPGLRRKKTPLFSELEDMLLQSEVNEESATRAYLAYLASLEKLANLEITSAVSARMHKPGDVETHKMIYFLGRTRGEKPDYYLRSCRFHETSLAPEEWSPWEKIDVPVHARNMIIKVVGNRPTIFWTEEQETAQVHGEERKKLFFTTLKYSYQMVSGVWIEPQIVEDWLHRPIGSLTQPKKGTAWKHKFIGNNTEIVYPSDVPEVRFTFDLSARDIGADGRHPGIDIGLHSLDDIGCRYSWAGKEWPFATEWALGYQRDAGWWLNRNQKTLFKGVDTPHIESLATSSDGKVMFGIAHPNDENKRSLMRSTDNGLTWELYQKGLGVTVPRGKSPADFLPKRLVAAARVNVVYAIGGAIKIVLFRSDDNGKTWKTMPTFHGPTQWHDLAVTDDGRFLAMVAYENTAGADHQHTGILYLSSDLGESWVECTAVRDSIDGGHVDKRVVAVTFDSFTGNMIVATATGRTLYSSDKGVTWHQSDLPQFYHLIGLFNHPKKLGTLVARRDTLHGTAKMFVTYDGGATYQEHDGADIPQDAKNVFLIDYDFYARTEADLLTLDRSDETWKPYSDLPDEWRKTAGTAPVQMASTGLKGGRVLGLWKVGLVNKYPHRTHHIYNAQSGYTSLYWDYPQPPNRIGQTRLSTEAPRYLTRKLLAHGIEAMLSLESQTDLIEPWYDGKPNQPIDFSVISSFAPYFRELFFHVPYLLADALNRNRKFDEARSWYHYIFRPNLIGVSGDDDDPMPYWRYQVFHDYTLRHLESFDPEELALYRDDPFDAHAIAAIRIGAYEKAVVMRYIDNLLDWADGLFRQENWESLTEAMSLYRQAADLLGPDPALGREDHALGSVTTLGELLPMDETSEDAAEKFIFTDRDTFPIPANTYFEGYWARTEDRITKIRLSEDIRGVKHQLSLFQPPIDPRHIMAALSAGMTLEQAYQEVGKSTPLYRFTALLGRAKQVASLVTGFGSALLAALEKKDVEGISHLRQTQEAQILDMVTDLRSGAIDLAQARKTALTERKADMKTRQKHYADLIKKGLLSAENRSLELKNDALALQSTTAAIRGASIAGYLAPNIFGMADGGQRFGQAIEIGAASLDGTAAGLNQSASLKDQRAQNDRRQAEWEWQLTLAGTEADRLQTQIDIAAQMVTQAEAEYSQHMQAVEHRAALNAYAEAKFTGRELYHWMVGQLSSLYMGGFNLALDLAQQAQQSFWFERACNDHIITIGEVHSLKGGLFASRDLELALTRLEKAYHDKAARDVEIEKTISLKYMGPDKALGGICADWELLSRTGSLPFTITQEFLQQDQFGDAHRRIHSVALTLPAMVAPYQNIFGTLTQTHHAGPDGKLLQVSGGGNVVAISTGVNDSGVFELRFDGDTYMPFEGTGAFSKWQLDMPIPLSKAFLDNLGDVVVRLRYKVPGTM